MTAPLPPDAIRKKAKSTTVPKAKTNSVTKQVAKDPVARDSVRAKHKSLSCMKTTEVALLDENAPLTEKAKLFVKFWAQGESISSASARAGYGDGAAYAYKLAHHPAAKLLYMEEKRLYEEAAQITRKDVMDMLIEAYDMAKMTAEPSTMVAAAREIGKMAGYYTIQVQVNHSPAGGPQDMSRRSDEELMEMIRKASQPMPPALPSP